MLKVIAAASLAAVVSASPLAASAQTSAAPSMQHQMHKPTGSYRSEMRKRHNLSRERARAPAEHMRQMRMQ